jgi:hypothetical protein
MRKLLPSKPLLVSLLCLGCAGSSAPAPVLSVSIDPTPEVAVEPLPEPPPSSDRAESFSEFARRFAKELSSEEPSLDRFIHPEWGLFVLHDPVSVVVPFYFPSFADLLNSEVGFPSLAQATLDCEFQEVDVVPRPLGHWPWECDSDIPPGCFIGSAGKMSSERFSLDHFGGEEESTKEAAALFELLMTHVEEAVFALSSTEDMPIGYLFRQDGTTFYLAIIDLVRVCPT